MGDGMSLPTVVAARMYLGQLQGHTGEDAHLSFEEFPYVGLSKVSEYTDTSTHGHTLGVCRVQYVRVGVMNAIKMQIGKYWAITRRQNHSWQRVRDAVGPIAVLGTIVTAI